MPNIVATFEWTFWISGEPDISASVKSLKSQENYFESLLKMATNFSSVSRLLASAMKIAQLASC